MTEVTLRNDPQQARSSVRLEQIKAAAIELYNDPEVGRDRLTTAMVVEKAGCSIGTFYRYLSDRFELLELIAPYRDQSPIVPIEDNPIVTRADEFMSEKGMNLEEYIAYTSYAVHSVESNAWGDPAQRFDAFAYLRARDDRRQANLEGGDA